MDAHHLGLLHSRRRLVGRAYSVFVRVALSRRQHSVFHLLRSSAVEHLRRRRSPRLGIFHLASSPSSGICVSPRLLFRSSAVLPACLACGRRTCNRDSRRSEHGITLSRLPCLQSSRVSLRRLRCRRVHSTARSIVHRPSSSPSKKRLTIRRRDSGRLWFPTAATPHTREPSR